MLILYLDYVGVTKEKEKLYQLYVQIMIWFVDLMSINNAGHTIYVNNNKYKTHLIPSGVFLWNKISNWAKLCS